MISPVSAPQRGQGPSSARSGRSFSLSKAAIWSTVSLAKAAIPSMKARRSPWPCSISESRCSHSLVLRLLLGVRLDAVDATPPGLERDLAARAEALLLDERDHGRARVAGRRMESGEEAPGDEIEDATLVGAEVVEVVVDVRRDDRVVVVDLRVVDDARERKLIEGEHVLGCGAVIRDRLQRPGGRLQLRDHVSGEIARRSARVRDRLLPLVERLRGLQRAARGESVAPVRIALQRRQVVEKRRALGLFLALD